MRRAGLEIVNRGPSPAHPFCEPIRLQPFGDARARGGAVLLTREPGPSGRIAGQLADLDVIRRHVDDRHIGGQGKGSIIGLENARVDVEFDIAVVPVVIRDGQARFDLTHYLAEGLGRRVDVVDHEVG